MNIRIYTSILRLLLLSILVAALAGCGRNHPAPPMERSELVLRFFRSMETGNAAAASEQGKKLQVMDSGNAYLEKLIAIQQSNTYLMRAQKALNSGNAKAALKILDEGLRKFPMNNTLKLARRDVKRLRNVPVLIAHLRRARSGSSAAMFAALNAANTGLPAELTPSIQAYLAKYKEEAMAKAAAEKKLTAEPSVPAALPEVSDSGR